MGDLSFQLLFSTIPYLCEVAPIDNPLGYDYLFEDDGEQKFYQKISGSKNSSKIQFLLPKNSAMAENSVLKLKESFSSHDWTFAGDFELNTENLEDLELECANYQKKLIPESFKFSEKSNRRTIGNLIVIATLVDKPENLGGITRTCEALGATALYVPNLRIVDDRV